VPGLGPWPGGLDARGAPGGRVQARNPKSIWPCGPARFEAAQVSRGGDKQTDRRTKGGQQTEEVTGQNRPPEGKELETCKWREGNPGQVGKKPFQGRREPVVPPRAGRLGELEGERKGTRADFPEVAKVLPVSRGPGGEGLFFGIGDWLGSRRGANRGKRKKNCEKRGSRRTGKKRGLVRFRETGEGNRSADRRDRKAAKESRAGSRPRGGHSYSSPRDGGGSGTLQPRTRGDRGRRFLTVRSAGRNGGGGPKGFRPSRPPWPGQRGPPRCLVRRCRRPDRRVQQCARFGGQAGQNPRTASLRQRYTPREHLNEQEL